MLHYTARNGTTFHFDPQFNPNVDVVSASDVGESVQIDMDDMREFVQHFDDLCDQCLIDLPPDADAAAIGPD